MRYKVAPAAVLWRARMRSSPMLFLSESIIDGRARLMRDVDRGKITSEQAYRRLLDLEPDDHIALLGMSRLRREAGDLAGAEDYLWRAAHAQPCTWPPYLELSELLSGQEALSQGLAELALSKLLLDEEGLEALGPNPIPFGLDDIEGYKDLSKHEQIELVVEALRRRRDLEPVPVTARLRPYRLIQQLHEGEDLDAQIVDALVQEGESIIPLLVGVLRSWAQSFLPEDEENVVENALALLGEIGHAGVIPHLLEFADLENVDLSGAAGWAFDRIIELHREQAVRAIGEIAPGLGANERILVLERLLLHPGLDASGELLARLSENLDRMPTPDLGAFLPTLVGTMIAARGRAGVEPARALMRRHSARLPRKSRRECEELIEALGAREALPPLPAQPSPWTVYDICGSKAAWEDDEEEEEEEEEDFALPPEPVQRRHTPGRNDPCWCGSGKKYKKCHLDSDETPGPQSAAPAIPGEFVGLRNRLGKYLMETASKRDNRLAQEEFFGDGPVEHDQMPLIDWMMHDWVPPRLGRTIMQEYLRERGTGLTPRERELVESWSQSYVGLYEVREVRVGSGVEVKDLVTGDIFFVHDVNLSKQLVRWDGLLARVVPGERGHEFSGVGINVPRKQLEPLPAWMEEDRLRTGMPWPEYLKRNLPRIRRQPERLHAEWVESLQLSNTDGEELRFSKAVYRVVDRKTLTAALRSCPEISKDDEGKRYVWLRGPAEEEARTVLGSIRVEGAELAFECNSKQRHERGKRMLAKLAGPALKHLRDEFTTQREMKRQTLEKPSAAGRLKVATLLRDFENLEEHKRQAGEPFYDVAWLRAELGLKE